MNGSGSVPPGIWKLVCSESWTPFFLACSETRYDEAFAKLQFLWGPAWEVYTLNPHLSASDRDALAFIVLCKAVVSFNSGMSEAAGQELLLSLGLYGWDDVESLVKSMTRHLYDVAWVTSIGNREATISSIPLPLFLLMIHINTEILSLKNNSVEAAEQLILTSTYLYNYFQLPSRSKLFEKAAIHPTWTAKKAEKAALMTLLRATDLLCQDGHYLTAWDVIDFSSFSRTANPALDLIRLRIAIQVYWNNLITTTTPAIKTGRHEHAAAIVHNLERTSALFAAVAKGLLYKAVEREDSAQSFETAIELLGQYNDSNYTGITEACLRNNIAVSHMYNGSFKAAFAGFYSALGKFLPIAISQDESNERLAPVPYRSSVGALERPVTPLYAVIRNVLTLNEFVPGATSMMMIKEAAILQGIREEDVVAELSKVASNVD